MKKEKEMEENEIFKKKKKIRKKVLKKEKVQIEKDEKKKKKKKRKRRVLHMKKIRLMIKKTKIEKFFFKLTPKNIKYFQIFQINYEKKLLLINVKKSE